MFIICASPYTALKFPIARVLLFGMEYSRFSLPRFCLPIYPNMNAPITDGNICKNRPDSESCRIYMS